MRAYRKEGLGFIRIYCFTLPLHRHTAEYGKVPPFRRSRPLHSYESNVHIEHRGSDREYKDVMNRKGPFFPMISEVSKNNLKDCQ